MTPATDFHTAIASLQARVRTIDALIPLLRDYARAGTPRIRGAGRRSMPEDERERVSRRMTRYWEGKRDAKKVTGGVK